MPTLDTCIGGTYEPGNIGASSGVTPVRPVIGTFEDPDDYDPDAQVYSLNFSQFWNSFYLGGAA